MYLYWGGVFIKSGCHFTSTEGLSYPCFGYAFLTYINLDKFPWPSLIAHPQEVGWARNIKWPTCVSFSISFALFLRNNQKRVELGGTFQSSCLIYIYSLADEDSGSRWDSGFWILCLEHIQIRYLELSVRKGEPDFWNQKTEICSPGLPPNQL